MSSILKALKKLEKKAPVESDVGSSLQQFYTKKPIVNGDLPANKHRLIIFTMLILMVVSGLILAIKPWYRQPLSTAKTDLRSELTPITPTETKTTTRAIIHETSRSIKDSEKVDSPKGAVKKPSLSVKKLKKEGSELFEKIETDSTEMVGIVAEQPSPQQPVKKKKLTEGNEAPSKQRADNAPFASIPIRSANESNLKLQAIAWSSNPAKRMAVINGQIVHEGGIVEMATIKHIGKNEIVIIKGSEKWRQLFRK